MSSENDELHEVLAEFRQNLVAAVQAEMTRHGNAVVAEVDRLREQGERERAELRADIARLAEQSSKGGIGPEQLQAIERKLQESESRQTRRLDDMSAGLEGLIVEAAKPMIADLREEQAGLGRQVESLDGNLRKFDEQAARMVTYFNDVSQQMEQRQDELGTALRDDIGEQLTSLRQLVEENDSTVRRFQNEVGQSVTQKLNDAEDRFNNRLLAAESRMKEDAGQKIAEIDAHVGRVSSGLDDTMNVLNDRIAGVDERIVEFGRRIEEIKESVKDIDSSALDEMKEKMSTAAGEAMLVRIEMERLEKGVNEKSDGLAVRVTELESQLADATMDVSTAVQLDRLEEIERALLEIDPTKFVLKDGAAPPAGGLAPPSSPPADLSVSPVADRGEESQESVKNSTPGADGDSGIDIAAIIAGADGDRGDTDHS
jgi:SMC interacting uncharacterized protein involved in chromosome segregation